MIFIHYFKTFFDLDELSQGQFFIRYLTLLALSAGLLEVDKALITEVNTDHLIVESYQWTQDGYFFKKIISFLSFLALWLGMRRFKSISGFRFMGAIPFSLYILVAIVASYYGFEAVFLWLLLVIPASRKKI